MFLKQLNVLDMVLLSLGDHILRYIILIKLYCFYSNVYSVKLTYNLNVSSSFFIHSSLILQFSWRSGCDTRSNGNRIDLLQLQQ